MKAPRVSLTSFSAIGEAATVTANRSLAKSPSTPSPGMINIPSNQNPLSAWLQGPRGRSVAHKHPIQSSTYHLITKSCVMRIGRWEVVLSTSGWLTEQETFGKVLVKMRFLVLFQPVKHLFHTWIQTHTDSSIEQHTFSQEGRERGTRVMKTKTHSELS